MMRARISTLGKWVGGIVLGSVCCALATSICGFEVLKIGGRLYERVSQHKELIADVLPPPGFVVEANLEAAMALSAFGQKNDHASRFDELKKVYFERREYWLRQSLRDELREKFLEESFRPANEFFEVGSKELFPAIKRGDREAADSSFARMQGAFDQHRRAIRATLGLAYEDAKAIEASASNGERRVIIATSVTSLLAVGLLLAAVLAVSLHIGRPLNTLANRVREMAGGEEGTEMPYLDRRDEIGEIAVALEASRVANEERRAALRDSESRASQATHGKAEIEVVARDFLEKADHLKVVLERQAYVVRSCAKGLYTSAQTTEEQSGYGLNASSEAASSVQSVALATSLLLTSTQQIAVQATEALSTTVQASKLADGASQDVRGLSNAAGRIRNILDTIRSIAAQTNLLSLNATIEAARAGAAGKGFAVVAAEVKNLAEQTSKATSEVAQLVAEISGSSEAAVNSITAITEQMVHVSRISSDISNAVKQQEAASIEISEGAARAAQNTDGALERANRIASIVTAVRYEATTTESAATSLFAALGEFNKSIDEFMGSISNDLKDRRRFTRHAVKQNVAVDIDGALRVGELLDVSLGGARIRSDQVPPIGTRVSIDFELSIETATVIWALNDEFGVQFERTLEEFPVSLAI